MTTTNLDIALEYLGRGWSVIPITPGTKKASMPWKGFQTTPMTEAMAESIWGTDPTLGVAVITGAVSGLLVVDVDTVEAGVWLGKHKLDSLVRVSTPNGTHHYFKHPGVDVPNSASSVAEGIDIRGDGGYVLAPGSQGYDWELLPGADVDDLQGFPEADLHRLTGKPSAPAATPTTPAASAPLTGTLADLDLSRVDADGTGGGTSFKDEIEALCKASPSGKIGEGRRNHLIAEFCGHALKVGIIGNDLVVAVHEFMNQRFESPLPADEVTATIRSITARDSQAYPGRAETEAAKRLAATSQSAQAIVAQQQATEQQIATDEMLSRFQTYKMSDIDVLKEKAGSIEYIIEPWLVRGGIYQLFGYAGASKSMVALNAMCAIAAGRPTWGPFKINHSAKVLYLDYENGVGALSTRIEQMNQVYGDTGENLEVWMPEVEKRLDLDLSDEKQAVAFGSVVDRIKPDIVVIDTVRSSFQNMGDENEKASWDCVNRICVDLSLRNIAVLTLHHANKPQGDTFGPGRSAGSGHQSTRLTRQMRTAQIFRSRDEAIRFAGIHNNKYGEGNSPCDLLEWQVPTTHRLRRSVEFTYWKTRDFSLAEDSLQFIGFATPMEDDDAPMVVSSVSTRQRAIDMAAMDATVAEISYALERTQKLIRQWLDLDPDDSDNNVDKEAGTG